jgi:hypothetical protein
MTPNVSVPPLSVLARSLTMAMLVATCAVTEVAAQSALRTEEVGYRSGEDGMALTAALALPDGAGPHPGVVVLSVAGMSSLVEHLTADGYVVLMPVRRGFVSVEPLLQASYDDLAADARAALDYLGSRPDVDSDRLAVIAQSDDTPPAMLASVAADRVAPLILLAPPAFPGRETFRIEQLGAAELAGMARDDLEALDGYVDEIADVVLGEEAESSRVFRLESLRAASPVELPRSAAYPTDERQTHFFASPLWHDRLAFDPAAVFVRLHSPVLVLIGLDDINTPLHEYLEAVDRGLSGAGTTDATLCLLPGRTRHAFTDEGIAAISGWLAGRITGPDSGGSLAGWNELGCVKEPEG